MSVPGIYKLMVPFLEAAGDGKEKTLKEIAPTVAKEMCLTEADLQQMVPSRQTTQFHHRLGWAKSNLKKVGLVENPNRGTVQITDRGRTVLAQEPKPLAQEPKPERINNGLLEKLFGLGGKGTEEPSEPRLRDGGTDVEQEQSPIERLESAYLELRAALADEVLEQVRKGTPKFLEHLVVKLLMAMGYGGWRHDAGRVTGRPGDEGIDGIIEEDKLGLGIICLQAKLWTNTVGSKEVQAFAGSMDGCGAKKGVFITAGTFSGSAMRYKAEGKKIILIDGTRLAELMIDYNVGVTPIDRDKYIIKKVDLDFFEEDMEGLD